MLKVILDKHIIFVAVGIAAAAGAVSKIIVNLTLKRLVRAAGNMSKSNHPFMRLVRAKFEHACMVSEKVENVDVFVDKYLYEYKAAGLKLHTLRRMEIAAAFLCVLLGAAGGVLEYYVNGMADMVLKTGAFGIGVGIFVYLFHLTTDENYRLAVIKNYMVDYLQNVCLHRYGKNGQKELQVMTPEEPYARYGNAAEPYRTVMAEKTSAEIASEITAQMAEERTSSTPAEETARFSDFGMIPDIPSTERTEFSAQTEQGARTETVTAAERTAPVSPTGRIERSTPAEPIAQAVQSAQTTPPEEDEMREPEKKNPVSKDILIRQILEEFMA